VSARERYLPLAESAKAAVPGARRLGPALPDEPVAVTVLLRSPSAAQARAADDERLTRSEYAHRFGAAAADIAAVESFADRLGLEVSEVRGAQRTVTLSGSAEQFAAAFRVMLSTSVTGAGVVFRGRTGRIMVPAPLAPIVEGVFGLDDRPQASPHFRRLAAPLAAHAQGFLPTEVAALYRFPPDADGRGQTVAVIELGGGYRLRDLKQYFADLGVAAPAVVPVGVDGARNAPTGDGDGPDGEVMLDLEIVGAVAPRARIAVYFAPNTSQGFLNAVLAAVHDDVRRPSVISISWGAPESEWTRQSLLAMDDAFRVGGLLGVTICAAAGDSGSTDGVDDGKSHVDFPSSSPHVLACGGTRLVGSRGRLRRETVWGGPSANGATGGGVSDAFALPEWQGSAKVPRSPNPGGFAGRGVPDVAGNADPATGYRVRVDGEEAVIGGTSAVAPLFAGLVALINQRAGRPVGYLNPLLYGSPPGLFRDVTSGTNGLFAAGRGWDACTGLGSPIGIAVADRLEPGRSPC
jgi:kumamolisin